MSRYERQVERWTGTSRVLETVGSVRATVRDWVDSARVVGTAERVGTRLARSTRASWLYRWLTAEPDPQVIVIDLQDTYTVGPIIAALDAVVEGVVVPVGETLAPIWRHTRTHEGLAWLSEVIATSRTGKVLAAVLEPPDVESRESRESREADERE